MPLAVSGRGRAATRRCTARRIRAAEPGRWLAFRRAGGGDEPDQELVGAGEAGCWPGRDDCCQCPVSSKVAQSHRPGTQNVRTVFRYCIRLGLVSVNLSHAWSAPCLVPDQVRRDSQPLSKPGGSAGGGVRPAQWRCGCQVPPCKCRSPVPGHGRSRAGAAMSGTRRQRRPQW